MKITFTEYGDIWIYGKISIIKIDFEDIKMAVNFESEDKLWEMSDILKGNIKLSGYKDVFLVLYLNH